MDKAEKEKRIQEKYLKKINQRIEQQQLALEEAEIDLAVSEKLDDKRGVERHQKRIDNIKERIEALKSE